MRRSMCHVTFVNLLRMLKYTVEHRSSYNRLVAIELVTIDTSI